MAEDLELWSFIRLIFQSKTLDDIHQHDFLSSSSQTLSTFVALCSSQRMSTSHLTCSISQL